MKTFHLLVAALLLSVSCAQAEEWTKFGAKDGEFPINVYFDPASVKFSKEGIIDVSMKAFYFTKEKPEGLYDIVMDVKIDCKKDMEMTTKAVTYYKDNSKPSHSALDGKSEWKKIEPGLPLSKLAHLLCPSKEAQMPLPDK